MLEKTECNIGSFQSPQFNKNMAITQPSSERNNNNEDLRESKVPSEMENEGHLNVYNTNIN